jgi:hypothetical protein
MKSWKMCPRRARTGFKTVGRFRHKYFAYRVSPVFLCAPVVGFPPLPQPDKGRPDAISLCRQQVELGIERLHVNGDFEGVSSTA